MALQSDLSLCPLLFLPFSSTGADRSVMAVKKKVTSHPSKTKQRKTLEHESHINTGVGLSYFDYNRNISLLGSKD